MAGRSRPTYREQNNNDLSNQVASGSTSHKRVSQHVSKPPVSPTSKQRDPLYEVDSSLLKKLNQGDGEYLVSIKSKIKNHTTAKATVMEHFHRLMKDTLGQRTYMSLVKNGVLNKNLPDELVTRKILDALELKNKLLFSSATTGSAINKLSFIQAVGKYAYIFYIRSCLWYFHTISVYQIYLLISLVVFAISNKLLGSTITLIINIDHLFDGFQDSIRPNTFQLVPSTLFSKSNYGFPIPPLPLVYRILFFDPPNPACYTS